MSDELQPTEDTSLTVREAAELARSEGLLPTSPEDLNIFVQDETALPMETDSAGNERGLSLRKAAAALGEFRRQREAERAALNETAVPETVEEPEEAPEPVLPQLDPNIAAMDFDALQELIVNDDDPDRRMQATAVWVNQMSRWHDALKDQHDKLALLAEAARSQTNLDVQSMITFAHQMSRYGLLARHGIQSDAELQQLASDDPARYKAIEDEWASMVLNLQNYIAQNAALQGQATEEQLAQAQAAQAQYQKWFDENAAQADMAFSALHPELSGTKESFEFSTAVVEMLQSLGLDHDRIATMWHTEPMFRCLEGQEILYRATQYTKLKNNKPKPSKKPVPPVSKPGSGADGVRYSGAQAALKEAQERAAENPSARNLARVLSAKRRAEES